MDPGQGEWTLAPDPPSTQGLLRLNRTGPTTPEFDQLQIAGRQLTVKVDGQPWSLECGIESAQKGVEITSTKPNGGLNISVKGAGSFSHGREEPPTKPGVLRLAPPE